MDFELLILGSDINAYSLARSYNEAYGKKAYVIGKVPMTFTSLSKILNISIEPNLTDVKVFKDTLKKFYLDHKDKKILLMPAADNYVRLIIENQDYLSKYFIFHKYSVELLDTLIVKELFYKNFKGVDIPETYIYNINDKLDIKKVENIGFPLILKPSNVIRYHEIEFSNQFKVFKIKSKEELISTIDKIKEAGYNDTLIIQKFIKGDDSYLFDCAAYLDRNGKVKAITFAQIGLQERTPTGIGNATVVVNGYSKYSGVSDTVNKLIKAIEASGYHGFCEFDLKYDIDDKKFKVLEINPRQGRCSFYMTFAGYNMIKLLADDLIYEKDLDYTFIDEEVCLSFVPKRVVKKYILDKDLLKEIEKLYRKRKVINPLKNRKDRIFKRQLWLFLRDRNYCKKYKNNKW